MTISHLVVTPWLQNVDEVIIALQPLSFNTIMLLAIYLLYSLLCFYERREPKTN